MPKVKNTTQSSYVEWLNSFEFTHFVTLTTRYELTLKSSRRLIERFHSKLKKHGFNPLIFWVAEKYEIKDGYHIHALMKLNRKIDKHEFRFITELYQIVAGTSSCNGENGNLKFNEWSRIDLQKYDPRRKAGLYVSKYVLKENNSINAEYDILF
jgi:hypothetical protein